MSSTFSICICFVVYCLLINTRWYIHFGLNIISTYLVLVPLLKDHRGIIIIITLFSVDFHITIAI